MSRMVYDWEEDGRAVCFRVNYEYVEGRFVNNYFVPGQIEVLSTEVLEVEYFNPAGDRIATIRGEDMQKDALAELNAEVKLKVLVEIDKCDYFFDLLVDNSE